MSGLMCREVRKGIGGKRRGLRRFLCSEGTWAWISLEIATGTSLEWKRTGDLAKTDSRECAHQSSWSFRTRSVDPGGLGFPWELQKDKE